MSNWKKENKEKCKEYHDAWKLKHKEKHTLRNRSYYKKWYKKNKETMRSNQRIWYEQNKETIRPKLSEYRMRTGIGAASSARYRARQRNVMEDFNRADRQLVKERFNQKCAICGAIDNLCIDHWLPLSKGNALTHQNAVLMCSRCNSKKRDKLPCEIYSEELIKAVESLFDQAYKASPS